CIVFFSPGGAESSGGRPGVASSRPRPPPLRVVSPFPAPPAPGLPGADGARPRTPWAPRKGGGARCGGPVLSLRARGRPPAALNLVLPLNVRVLVVVVPDLVLQETGRLQVAVKVGLQLFLGDEVESPVLGLQAAKVVGLALVAVALGGLVETVVTRLHALGIG